MGGMDATNENLRKKIDIPFCGQEREQFERYLEQTGRKAGPLVRQLILRELAREKRASYPAKK